MGMTIDEAIPILHDMYNYYNDVDVDVDAYVGFDNEDNNAIETALETMRKYQMMQADYETRLKADMVAMLTEIQLEIEEKSYYDTTIIGNYEDEVRIDLVELDDVNEVIQQKINALKTEIEPQESEDNNG